jgi:hypothetical protein
LAPTPADVLRLRLIAAVRRGDLSHGRRICHRSSPLRKPSTLCLSCRIHQGFILAHGIRMRSYERRSSRSITRLASRPMEWMMASHPAENVRQSPCPLHPPEAQPSDQALPPSAFPPAGEGTSSGHLTCRPYSRRGGRSGEGEIVAYGTWHRACRQPVDAEGIFAGLGCADK